MSRLLAIAIKEMRQVRRDRMTLAMMIAIPLMQLLLFGYAINTDVRHIPTVVLDHDRSAASRDLVARMRATGFYDIVGAVRDYAEVTRAIRGGDAHVGLVIPPRFSADIARGVGSTAQIIVDGSDPLIVSNALSTAVAIAEVRSTELRVARLGRAGRDAVRVDPDILYNPELRSAVFIVPGLIGVLLTMTMVMFTSMAIARERERGTLEALIVSPIRSVELMVGKIVPYIVIGYVQMTVILVVGALVFDVPIRGSITLLYLLSFIFIAANLALGLVFSTFSKTQQQAMQLTFFFLLPNILLSGFMFPFDGMPRLAQWLGLALPLTHFLRIVRGITLAGASTGELIGQLVWLTSILGAFILLASLRFRKKLG
ncbi:MAG: ABC transporter permease [Myxococcales bacterium]|nr:ABC transporter permease [Myxococcales bacterium]